jgi:hypothetical protein
MAKNGQDKPRITAHKVKFMNETAEYTLEDGNRNQATYFSKTKGQNSVQQNYGLQK